MPWTAKDAKGHCKAADTEKKRRGWAEAANSARAKALEDGKSEKEADTIGVKVGNEAVANIKEEAATSGTFRFQEFANPSRQDTARVVEVDEAGENAVIRDVLILGMDSRGMGVYSQPVMEEALKLYDGAPTYVNHNKNGGHPSYFNKLGVHRNPRMSPQGIRTDFHFNAKHPAASQVIFDAKSAPNTLGFSHDASCQYRRDGKGRRIVEKIIKVHGVDLVSNAGTVKGLWEEEESLVSENPEMQRLAESSLAAMDNARTILFDPVLAPTEKQARLLEALTEWTAELTNQPPDAADNLTEETTMEFQDITLETLKANRPDLVEVLQGTDEHSRLTEEVATQKAAVTAKEAEIARLAEENKTLKTTEAKRLQEAEIAAELKEAFPGVPTDDATVYSAEFKEQLTAAPDKPTRAKIIAHTKRLVARLHEAGTGAPPFAEIPNPDAAPAEGKIPTFREMFGGKN